MPAFVPVAFLDTFDLVASLRERMDRFRSTGEAGLTELRVREESSIEGKGHVWYKPYAEWPELKATIQTLRGLGDRLAGAAGIELGRVFLEMLDPGTTLPWTTEESEFVRVEMALRTNPGARLFVGTESTHLLPGQLTIVATGVPRCAVNLGEWPRVHLVVEFRRRETAD